MVALYVLAAVYGFVIIIGLTIVLLYPESLDHIESNRVRLDECQIGTIVIPINQYTMDLFVYNYPQSEIIEFDEDVVKLKSKEGKIYHLYKNNMCLI